MGELLSEWQLAAGAIGIDRNHSSWEEVFVPW
jgi:hypothetical protein